MTDTNDPTIDPTGGEDSVSFEQDTGSLKWAALNVAGAVPTSRSGHTLNVINNYAFCFGG